jgi:hypothetical protein
MVTVVVASEDSGFLRRIFSSFSSSFPSFFGPSLQPHYRTFFATTASADYSPALAGEFSLGKIWNLSLRAARLYRKRLG